MYEPGPSGGHLYLQGIDADLWGETGEGAFPREPNHRWRDVADISR
jgi:hypothetical protein